MIDITIRTVEVTPRCHLDYKHVEGTTVLLRRANVKVLRQPTEAFVHARGDNRPTLLSQPSQYRARGGFSRLPSAAVLNCMAGVLGVVADVIVTGLAFPQPTKRTLYGRVADDLGLELSLFHWRMGDRISDGSRVSVHGFTRG